MPWDGLFAVVKADRDNRVRDERAVAAVLIQQFQTARYHSHLSVAVGECVSNLSDLFTVQLITRYIQGKLTGNNHN